MSYLFCAFLYNRKSFDPRLIVDLLNDEYAPEGEHDAMVKVPVKGSIDAVFMLPLRKEGLKTQAYFDALEFIEEEFVELLDRAISAGRGVVDPRVKPVVYALGYCDMTPHNVVYKISPDGVDYRAIIQDEGHHIWMPTGGDSVERHENIGVDDAEFGVTEESDADFREDEYFAEVERRERPFSPAVLLNEDLRLKTDHLLDALERLEQGEKIWPEARKVKAPKKAPKAKDSKKPAKKAAKAKPTRK